MDHLIPAIRPDLALINKKRICHIVDFAVSVDDRVKIKESGKLNKYLDLARELKKTVAHVVDSDTNCSWYT